MKLFASKGKKKPDEEQATVDTTPAASVRSFLDAFTRRDVGAAMAVVAPDARVTIHPIGVRDGGPAELRALLTATVTAFPDLLLTIARVIVTGSVVTAELKVEGTQAADYLGAVNQEKHLDVDQGWRFTVAGDRITGVEAFWCQNQLYRRLAVKRLDQIAIVG